MSGTIQQAAPRLQVVVNGTALPALAATVNSNNYYHADAFTVKFLATDTRLSGAGFGMAFWGNDATGGSSNPVDVDIQVDPGTSQSPNWTSLLTGRVDHVAIDPMTGEVDLTGRDRTADYIEAKTFATFKNQTSSQIAQKLAANHGMQAQVTPTTTLVERYYAQDHDKITLGNFSRVTTEWDLLTFLAQQEGFDVFTKGNTLYFQAQTPPSQNPTVITLDANTFPWVASNAVTVKLERALTLARDIKVIVQSWSSKTASAFKVTAQATGANKSGAAATAKPGSTTTQTYVYTRPNLTHDQAQALAQKKLAELSLHERVVTVTLAGEVSMSPRGGLRISGSGTMFDIDYYITEISREIDHTGFTQTVTAKNSSPKDTSIVG